MKSEIDVSPMNSVVLYIFRGVLVAFPFRVDTLMAKCPRTLRRWSLWPLCLLGGMMNIYKRMKLVLKDSRVKKVVQGKPRRDRRAIARRKLIPNDCICPNCGEVVLESNRWVVTKPYAICKSCFQKAH